MISETSKTSARTSYGIVLLFAVTVLGGCSTVQSWWPWHHAPPAPEPPVTELVVATMDGSTPPALLQSWDRNALRVDLTGLSGEGDLRVRPAPDHGWPIRLEFAARPGSFARLQVSGEQKVTIFVPSSGATATLAVPQGTYARTTGELALHYGP